ncbi:MAG: chlorophyll a/b-binding protein [Cyanobacteria bacterium P01_G01_bin.38]
MERSTQKTTSTKVGNLPLKENQHIQIWGFNPSTEILNGRLAMLGFVAALLLEFFSGQGVLRFLDLL